MSNALTRLIAERREEQRLTYGEIARVGGLPKSTVYKLATIEKWTNAPQAETLDRLARGLGLPPSTVRQAAAEAAGLTEVVEDDPAMQILIGSIAELTAEQREQVAALVNAMQRGN
jgi:transcriptional regulator with XRE-family HTH domain